MFADVLEPIAIYDSYDEADDCIEHFCNVYPNGWLEIMSETDFIIATGA